MQEKTKVIQIQEYMEQPVQLKEGKLISTREFAAKYGIGVNKAYEIVHAKGFPMVRFGTKILIISSKVDEWFEKNIGNTF